MSRKLFIAGNWKMNTSRAEAAALVGGGASLGLFGSVAALSGGWRA